MAVLSRRRHGYTSCVVCLRHSLVNLGDLGPDALAAYDAANEGSNAGEEEDDDEDEDDDAGLHPVSQMMFPLDDGKEAAAASLRRLCSEARRVCPVGTRSSAARRPLKLRSSSAYAGACLCWRLY
jgi:hypothetical protein